MYEVKTAVLLPCRNEAGVIENVIANIRAEAPEMRIFVCDNASSDKTGEKAEKAGAVVITEPKPGKGYAVSALFDKIRAQCYIMCDGDGTYETGNIRDIENLILNGGCDLVTCDRLTGNRADLPMSYSHRIGNRIINGMVRLLYGPGISDILSGYRGMSGRFVNSLPPLKGGFTLETELSVHALTHGFKIANIPVRTYKRGYGKSKVVLSDGLKIVWTLIRLRVTHPHPRVGACKKLQTPG